MNLFDKVDFDLRVKKASPLEVVQICLDEMDILYATSESLGGVKWACSQLRKGLSLGKDSIPTRPVTMSRVDYGNRVAAEIIRLASVGTNPETLKSVAILSLLRLDPQDGATYRIEQKDAVVKDQDLSRGRRKIVAVDRFIEIGESLLQGRSYISRILGLCALTGRRTFEIGCTAQFTVKDSNHVVFTGQAKGRDRKDLKPYIIPTLTDSTDILIALNSIRRDKPELVLHPDTFHNKCAKDLHKKASIFGEVFGEPSAKPKDLRSAWAEIVYLLFDDRKTGKALFLSRMLGHGDDDLLTAQSYDDFYITDPDYS